VGRKARRSGRERGQDKKEGKVCSTPLLLMPPAPPSFPCSARVKRMHGCAVASQGGGKKSSKKGARAEEEEEESDDGAGECLCSAAQERLASLAVG